MESLKSKTYTYFIGIDISKDKLDYAVMCGKDFLYHKEIKNNSEEIKKLITEVKALPKFVMTKAIFCMEQTGIYANHLLSTMGKAKANVVIQNALHIRNSLGVLRGKYDKIDAIRISMYAYKNRDDLRLWKPRRDIIDQLAHMASLRTRLLQTQKTLKTPLSEQRHFLKKKFQQFNERMCAASIAAIKEDILQTDEMMLNIVEGDENLKRLMRLVTSVPSIGPVTALQIIISTNEFKDINSPKKFACYAGVAPFKKDSGTVKVRAKVSNFANKRVKSLLHICAVGAIRFDKELKAYFERKTLDEGKARMAVINAVRYKLILRVFACVAQNREFSNEYSRATQLLITA
jgi:transposase